MSVEENDREVVVSCSGCWATIEEYNKEEDIELD
jgi:hypothetical protein